MDLDRLPYVVAGRLRSLFRRGRVERELDEELRYHLERQAEVYAARGMSPAAARSAALQAFGGVEFQKERARDARGVPWFDELSADVRYALRTFRRSPAFAAVAVATLALGIGATSAVFSLVDGILLKPLPFPEPERLVRLVQSWPEIGLERWGLSQTNAAVYHDRQKSFSSFAAFTVRTATLGGERPSQLNVTYATADFFGVLDVAPMVGRPFLPSEDVPGRNHVIILSYGLWQQRFGGDRKALGTSVSIDGFPATVIGVMRPGFAVGTQASDAWMPLGLDRNRPWGWFLAVIGRLRPGVTPDAAARETTDILWAATREDPVFVGRTQVPDARQHIRTIVTPLREALVGKVTRPLLVLQVAVALILLIAAANVATLLLGRGVSRSRELTLRIALGASRGRVVRQLLTETVVLALAGALIGLGLAAAGVRLLPHLPITSLPRVGEVHVDGRVLGFAILLSVVVGILFGLAPALHTHRLGLSSDLNEGPRGSARGPARRTHATLVVGQLALTVVLLIGAGLVLKTVQRLLGQDLGFRPEGITLVNLPLPRDRYEGSSPEVGARINAFTVELLDRVRRLPGVSRAAVAWGPPFWGSGRNGYRVEGHEVPAGAEGQTVTNAVSPGYFATMEIPLKRGRDFTAADRDSSALVVIVDQTLARRFWPDGDAIGRRIQMTGDTVWRTIVGLVGGVLDNTPSDPPIPHTYFPYSQEPGRFVNLEVRTSGDAAPTIAAIRRTVAAIEPQVPLDVVQPLTDTIRSSVSDLRLTEILLGGFALLALLLAAVGVYGVMNLAVAARRREFGIRLAIGAEPGTLLRLVLGQGLRLAAAGAVLGVAGAWVVTRWMRGLLYGVSTTDPVVFTALPLLLVAIAIASCAAPSLRAAGSDPLEALRVE